MPDSSARPGAARRLPQVVASDCDGTLLRADGTVSARTRRALRRVEAAGAEIVLVTARPPRWMAPLAEVAGAHGVVLCGNGAFVYDTATRQVTDERPIAAEVVREITADLRRALPGIRFAVERSEGYAREPDYVSAIHHPEPDEVPVGMIHELLSPLPGKLLAQIAGRDDESFHQRVAEVVGERAVVSYSGATGLAEISAVGVTKAAALADWCASRGVGSGAVWAFGDMPNDLPMLTWAGRSFAVANAHAEVLRAASDRCASNDEDGVAQVLEAAFGEA